MAQEEHPHGRQQRHGGGLHSSPKREQLQIIIIVIIMMIRAPSPVPAPVTVPSGRPHRSSSSPPRRLPTGSLSAFQINPSLQPKGLNSVAHCARERGAVGEVDGQWGVERVSRWAMGGISDTGESGPCYQLQKKKKSLRPSGDWRQL